MQFLVALIVGVGVGLWIYNRYSRKAADDKKPAIIVGAVVGLFAFFIVWMLALRFLTN